MTGGEASLAFFLLLELEIGTPLGCFIYDNKKQAWVDLWLLLSKWGGGGEDDMGPNNKDG
jgi:hypothetical protein